MQDQNTIPVPKGMQCQRRDTDDVTFIEDMWGDTVRMPRDFWAADTLPDPWTMDTIRIPEAF